MAKQLADVLLCWYSCNKEVQAVRSQFQRPTRFIEMPAGGGVSYRDQFAALGPRPLKALCQKYLPDVTPQRIAVMGFSEGCQGVREAIKSGDGKYIDSAIAIDGIHTQWTDKKKKTFDTSLLLPWRAMAKAAVEDGRMCLITTSAVQPDFVSTTTTSNWLWTQAAGEGNDGEADAPAFLLGPVVPPYTNPAGSFGAGQAAWPETKYTTYPLKRYRKLNGLVIVNYDNLDPTGVGDHRFQAARVAPLVLENFLVARWNGIDPAAPCLT